MIIKVCSTHKTISNKITSESIEEHFLDISIYRNILIEIDTNKVDLTFILLCLLEYLLIRIDTVASVLYKFLKVTLVETRFYTIYEGYLSAYNECRQSPEVQLAEICMYEYST